MDQKQALDILAEAVKKLQMTESLELKQTIAGECSDTSISILLKRIGSYLKRARNVKGITQTGLADKCDSSIYMIAKLERGNSIEFDHFLRFMKELGVLESIVLLFEYHLQQLQKEEENITEEA